MGTMNKLVCLLLPTNGEAFSHIMFSYGRHLQSGAFHVLLQCLQKIEHSQLLDPKLLGVICGESHGILTGS